MVPKSQRNSSLSSSKDAKQPKKQASKPAAAKPPALVAAVAAVDDEEEHSDDYEDVESDSDSDDEDDEYDGVTEEGMNKLMELLGKDGLNEFDMDVLSSVAGGEEEEDEDEDEDEEDDEEELEYGSGDGSQLDDEEDDDDEEMNDDEEENDEAAFESILKSTTAPVQEQTADDLALDEVESNFSVDEDAVPARKVIINNQTALKQYAEEMIITKGMPFGEHLTLTTRESLEEVDPNDDLKREVAFYKQALSIVDRARKLCKQADIPFTRPNDYYAEMVKSDVHMERVRTRLVDEASGIKKSEAAKKQRDLKKYGKQIQHEKLKQRVQDRKGMDERIRGIKRKRKDGVEVGDEGEGGAFDVRVEDAIEGRGGKDVARGGRAGGKPKMPRHARDSKFGMGGGGKRSKQNTRESTNDFGSGGGRGKPGAKGGASGGGAKNRPGKARRNKGRN